MLMFGGLDISDNERMYIGEALIVYLHRALNKPAKPAYFHVTLLDILIRSARDALQLSFGISWAKGTGCLKAFDRRSNLDEHPNAPEPALHTIFTRCAPLRYTFMPQASVAG